MYAAVTEDVVWGIGKTEEEAYEDALDYWEGQVVLDDMYDLVWLVKINQEEYDSINSRGFDPRIHDEILGRKPVGGWGEKERVINMRSESGEKYTEIF